MKASKTMKKSLLILLLTALCLTACGSKDVQNNAADSSSEKESYSTSDQSDALTYRISIPKDFSEAEIEGMEFYYTAQDGSGISLNLQPKDPDFSQVSASLLNDALSDTFLQTYKEDVAITDNYFTTVSVSGYPAYQYSVSYKLQDIAVTQIIVGVDADQTYTFTYTDLTGTWNDTFKESINTIRIIPSNR